MKEITPVFIIRYLLLNVELSTPLELVLVGGRLGADDRVGAGRVTAGNDVLA